MNINKLMTKIKYLSLAVLVVMSISAVLIPATGVFAQAAYDCDLEFGDTGYSPTQAGLCDAVSERNQSELFDTVDGKVPLFQRVVNMLLFLVGSISVIMLIIGGIRYIVSSGDQNQVTGAKNTIMYAIIGILVAVMAYGIVNFLLTRFYA